ncbi:17102_t:CDS:2, partial [Funneliformis caledonium]
FSTKKDGNGHKKYRMQCDSGLSKLSEPSELQLKAVEIMVSSLKKLPVKAREDFNVRTSKIDMTKKSHGLNPLPMVNKTYGSKVMLNNIDAYLVFICVSQLNEKDAIVLNKAIQYSQKAFDEALAIKETVFCIEAVINEFIKEQKASKDLNMELNECLMDYKKMSGKNTRKKTFWYNVNKNPTDDIMRDTVYNALVEEHPDKIIKIEYAKGGWSKYWTE